MSGTEGVLSVTVFAQLTIDAYILESHYLRCVHLFTSYGYDNFAPLASKLYSPSYQEVVL